MLEHVDVHYNLVRDLIKIQSERSIMNHQNINKTKLKDATKPEMPLSITKFNLNIVY